MMRHTLLILALLCASTAQAEPKDDARRHFRAGLTAIEDGDLELALQRFIAAQAAYPHPVTIYNIARVYSDLGDFSNALMYFRLYRDTNTADGANDVDPIIAAMEARSAAGISDVTVAPVRQESGNTDNPDADGLSEAEVARLEDIATELDALSQAFTERGSDETAERTAKAAEVMRGVASGIDIDLGSLGMDEMPVDINNLDLGSLGVSSYLVDGYERSVVTASRYGQDPLDSPASLSVLTAEDIRLSGVVNLADLLRRVTGIDVNMEAAGNADISIRGFNDELNNKVIILIDGRSTYWDFIGASLAASFPINLLEIERIEVIRGPGSSVYGANAVTGVINIITKVPGDVVQTLIQTELGTVGYGKGSLMTSGTAGEHKYRFGAEYEEHGRWETLYAISDFSDSALVPVIEDTSLGKRTVRLSGRVDRTFGRSGFASVSGGYADGFIEFMNIGALEMYGMDYQSFNLRGDLSWGSLHLRSFWNSDAGVGNRMVVPREVRYDTAIQIDGDVVDFEAENPVSFTTGKIDHTFNIGAGYRNKRIAMNFLEGGFDNAQIQHHYAAFVHEEATLGNLKLVGSGRVDKHPFVPNILQTMSPRGAVIYRVAPQTSVRATAGTSFRAPNGIESYTDLALSTPFDGAYVQVLGDRGIVPERISTYEVGVHDESTDFHVADVVVFVNKLNQATWLPGVTPQLHYFNAERGGFSAGEIPFENTNFKYNAVGIEAEGRIFPTDGMDLFANVDVQNTTKPQRAIPSFMLPAKLKINGGWMYRTPLRTDLSLMAHYVSSQVGNLQDFDDAGVLVITETVIPSRVIVSTRVAVRPTKDENLELAFVGWNLTSGKGFVEHAYGQRLRSRIHGSVRYSF